MKETLLAALKDRQPRLGAHIGSEDGEVSGYLTNEIPGLRMVMGGELANSFDNESFDFILIDRNEESAVRDDLVIWYDLIKQGGLIIGTNYTHKTKGVQIAVAEAFNLLHVVLMPDGLWMVQK